MRSRHGHRSKTLIQGCSQGQEVDLKKQVPVNDTFISILIPDSVDMQGGFCRHDSVDSRLPFVRGFEFAFNTFVHQ